MGGGCCSSPRLQGALWPSMGPWAACTDGAEGGQEAWSLQGAWEPVMGCLCPGPRVRIFLAGFMKI